MDRYQPAYWLSKDPAEAADFLARTAIASRVVGGFVKRSVDMDPRMQDVFTHAAIGAGVGGLGGLGVGLFSKRRKNPLTTALTGAVLGGVAGGAFPEAYRAYKNYANAPVDTQAAADQTAQAAKVYDTLSPEHRRLIQTGALPKPTIDPAKLSPVGSLGAPPVPNELQQHMDADTWDKQLADRFSRVTTGTKDIAKDNIGFDRPVTAAALTGGALATNATAYEIMRRIKKNVAAWNEFERGVPGLPAYEPGSLGTQVNPNLSVQGATPVKPTLPTPSKNVQTYLAQEALNRMAPQAGRDSDWLRVPRQAILGHKVNRMGRAPYAPNVDRLGMPLKDPGGTPYTTGSPYTPRIGERIPEETSLYGSTVNAARQKGVATPPTGPVVPSSAVRRWGARSTPLAIAGLLYYLTRQQQGP